METISIIDRFTERDFYSFGTTYNRCAFTKEDWSRNKLAMPHLRQQ